MTSGLPRILTESASASRASAATGADTVFEMEIGTNRPDAMNHYGVAREAAAIYDLPLKPIEPKLPQRLKPRLLASDATLKGRSSTA